MSREPIYRHYLYRKDELGPSDLLCLLAIATVLQDDTDYDGGIIPAGIISVKQIAHIARISEDRASSIVRNLTRVGEIVTYRNTDPDGASLANSYWLVSFGKEIGYEPPKELQLYEY